jgi:hypothetical protein
MNANQPDAAGPRVVSSFSRPLSAIGLVAAGIFLAWFMLGIGYFVLVGLLDATCCPPLEAQGNFGQFGFLIILIAPMILICGSTFCLIPFLRWWIWAFCFAIIFGVSYLVTGFIEPWHYNQLHVTNIAIYLTGLFLCLCGILARIIYRYIELRELDDDLSTGGFVE